MPTRGVGHAHRNQPKMARFCPWCGVEALQRDFWRKEHQIPEAHIEYICTACGCGFNLSMSNRANYAVRLLREHSKLRNGCVNTDDGNTVPRASIPVPASDTPTGTPRAPDAAPGEPL